MIIIIIIINGAPVVVNAVQYDSDISAYTVEKTMDMESRIKAMRELHVATRRTSLQMRRTSLQMSVTSYAF